jgi:hypothetical protein
MTAVVGVMVYDSCHVHEVDMGKGGGERQCRLVGSSGWCGIEVVIGKEGGVDMMRLYGPAKTDTHHGQLRWAAVSQCRGEGY